LSVFKPQTRTDDAVIPDELVRLSQIGGGAAGLTFARIIKKVDQIINNTTTLTDDDELLVALSANKLYAFQLIFYSEMSVTADMKFNFSIPAGASGFMLDQEWRSNDDQTTVSIPTNMIHATSVGTHRAIAIYGFVDMGGTAGNFVFQFAQNTAQPSDMTIRRGSIMLVWEEQD